MALLMGLSIVLSCAQAPDKEIPTAKNGTIDLRNWDLEKDGPIKLDGEWNFFWGDFIPPEKIKDNNPEKIAVPSGWYTKKISNKNYDRYGYATYHLKILYTPTNTPLSLKFGTFGSACEAYLNGKKIYQAGKIGKSFESMKARFNPEIIDFWDNNNELDLVIYVSNFNHRVPGIWSSLYFGKTRDLYRIKDTYNLMNLFLAGVFVIMFLYHIGIFLLRRKDTTPVYFALFCIFLAIRMLTIDEIVLLDIFPAISFSWLKTIEYATFYLAIPSGCIFVYKLFPDESNKILFFIFNTPVIIIAIVTFFTPIKIFCYLLFIVQICSILISFYIIYITIYGIIKKREGAFVLLTGIASLMISTIIDILNSMFVLNLMNFSPYGLLIMIFSQSYILSKKFSRSFLTVEKLTSTLKSKNIELKDLNMNLEKKVEERTKKLYEANKEISSINENLLKTKNKLWGEMEIAKKIQTILLPKEPKIPAFKIAAYMLPAEEVGGDYYDIINTETNDWILIGDVSGHGVPAGLIMMMVQASLRSHVMLNSTIKPSHLLENINSSIGYNLKNMNEQKFMTLTAFSYDKNNKIIFSGKHEDILIYRLETEEVEVIKTAGICISQIQLGEKDKNTKIQINKGDKILLFTDGLIEAWEKNQDDPENKKMFGQEKLIEIFKKEGKKSPEEIKAKLLLELQLYSLDDDVTFLILEKL